MICNFSNGHAGVQRKSSFCLAWLSFISLLSTCGVEKESQVLRGGRHRVRFSVVYRAQVAGAAAAVRGSHEAL